uniref:V-SNARE coiled-coil homology domain-containing protein n=1 Tax=Astatotilapia calliptera TaxID=8154 RepID=A0AAX7TS30_ASTCA
FVTLVRIEQRSLGVPLTAKSSRLSPFKCGLCDSFDANSTRQHGLVSCSCQYLRCRFPLTPQRTKENGKSHLQKTQEEVEEVKVIMLQNMNKAEERSGKLNELEDRADLLLEESKKFEKTSTQVKTQKRWANKKMKVVLIAVAVVAGLIILSLIIVAIVQSTKGSD